MAVEWFCRLMGTEMGPYTSAQLIEMVKSHQLTPEDLVKRGADGQWIDAHRVKGLFDDAASSSIIRAQLPPEVRKAAHDREQEAPAKPPKPARVDWYYISNHNKVGPLTFEDLVTHGLRGLIRPSDRVWSSKSPKWCEARKVKGLSLRDDVQ